MSPAKKRKKKESEEKSVLKEKLKVPSFKKKKQEKSKCRICGVLFSSPSDLKRHILHTHVLNYPHLLCHICYYKAPELNRLKHHYKNQHKGEPFPEKPDRELICNFSNCSFTTMTVLEMRVHTFDVHYPQLKIPILLPHLDKAPSNHASFPVQCLLCNKLTVYKNDAHITKHFEEVHQSSKNMNMLLHSIKLQPDEWFQICKNRHNNQTENIMVEEATAVKIYRCKYPGCTIERDSLGEFREHLMIHEDFANAMKVASAERARCLRLIKKPCGINNCSFVCRTYKKMDDHRKTMHNKSGLQCIICQEIYFLRGSFLSHIRNHHALPHCTIELMYDETHGLNDASTKVVAEDHMEVDSEGGSPLESHAGLNVPINQQREIVFEPDTWIDKSIPDVPVQWCKFPGCDFRTNSEYRFSQHSERHYKNNLYRCLKCSQLYTSECCVKIHIDELHGPCYDLSQMFEKIEDEPGGDEKGQPMRMRGKKYGGKTNGPKIFGCAFCQRWYASKYTLDTHQNKKHGSDVNNDAQSPAENVDPRFTEAQMFQMGNNYKCDYKKCAMEFENFTDYQIHALDHSHAKKICQQRKSSPMEKDKPLLQCSVPNCNFESFSDRSMKRHKTRHFWNYPLQCKVCLQLYEDFGTMCLHLAGRHGVNKNPIAHYRLLENQDPELVLLYKCFVDGCNYETRMQFDFNRHLMKHVAEKEFKYKCGICGLWFSDANHVREHFVQKHPMADYCIKETAKDLTFGTPNELLCTVCNKVFGDHKLFLLHNRMKHPELVRSVRGELYPFTNKQNVERSVDLDVEMDDLKIPKLVLVGNN